MPISIGFGIVSFGIYADFGLVPKLCTRFGLYPILSPILAVVPILAFLRSSGTLLANFCFPLSQFLQKIISYRGLACFPIPRCLEQPVLFCGTGTLAFAPNSDLWTAGALACVLGVDFPITPHGDSGDLKINSQDPGEGACGPKIRSEEHTS